MKEFYLEEHSWSCPCNIEATPLQWKKFCELNPERFLFLVENKFVLITYNKCMNFGDQYEYKKKLIDKVIQHNKVFDYYELNRIDVEKDLRDFRIRNIALKKYIRQVNYLYYNNAGKKFAITTDVPYIETLAKTSELRKNYDDAMEFLKNNEYNYLLNDLRDLFCANTYNNNYEAQYIKTIDHLVKEINKLATE
jgi:hypothetical protein